MLIATPNEPVVEPTLSVTGQPLERSLRFAVLLDATQIEALVEARVTLETQLAAFAAERRTAGDIEAIAEAIEGMRAAGQDAEAYLASDLRFHLAIAAHTNLHRAR